MGGASVRPGGAAWTGIVLAVLAWGFVLSLFFLSRERLWGMGRGGRITADLYLAAATLARMAIALAYYTVRGVRRRQSGVAEAARRQPVVHRLAALQEEPPGDGGARGDDHPVRRHPGDPAGGAVRPGRAGRHRADAQPGAVVEHLMGTDKFGRDIFSRVLYGSRISLTIGFIAVGISVTLGTLVGALAGYFGGFVDTILMRMTDMMLSFPRLVLLIVVIALFSPPSGWWWWCWGSPGGWPRRGWCAARCSAARARVRAGGARAGDGRLADHLAARHPQHDGAGDRVRHAGIGQTILTEASLSFLGLGVQPPTPSWGNMVADGRDALIEAWWIATFPGIAIVLTVIAFNLLGDGLRDALDPRLRT
jgi:peptide/nickel transport system permease protein